MTEERLSFDRVSQQLGIDPSSRRRKSDGNLSESTTPTDLAGDLQEQPEIMTVSIVDQLEDPQPVEQKPLWRMLLIGGALACTVGVGVVVTLWDGGGQPQEAKNVKGSSPTASPQSNPEKDKEVADLKAKVALEEQKRNAERIANASASASASPSSSSSPDSSSSPSSAASPGSVAGANQSPSASPSPKPSVEVASPNPRPSQTYQPPRPVQSIPIVAQRPTTENTQAAQRPKDQESSQLTALKRELQKEKEKLADLQRGQKANTNLAAATSPQPIRQESTKIATVPNAVQSPIARQPSSAPVLQKQKDTSQPIEVARTRPSTARPNPQPTEVARTQPSTARPSTQPTEIAMAKSDAKPKSQMTQPPEAPVGSWEQAAAMGTYGGSSPVPTASASAANPGNSDRLQEIASQGGAMSPILRLPVGESVPAKLVTPFYALIKNNESAQPSGQSLGSVVLDKPIEVGSGWHLPAGTAIEFSLQVADNGLVEAVSKKVTYGNTVILIPEGAFSLTNESNQPLMAEVKEVNGDKLTGADIRGALWGAAGKIGNALVTSGNQATVSTSGFGTTISTSNNPAPNILGAALDGAFTPQAQKEVARSEALAQRLQKQSKIGFLNPGTKARVYVARSVAFQVPVDGDDRLAFGNPSLGRVASREIPQPTESSAAENLPPPAPPTKAETEALPPPTTVPQTGSPQSNSAPPQTRVVFSPAPISPSAGANPQLGSTTTPLPVAPVTGVKVNNKIPKSMQD